MRDFQDLIRHCSFTELKTHGPPFTWCNKREEGLICKKLDRVLSNVMWQTSYPQSYCRMEPGGCSDHLRGKLSLTAGFQKPKGPFKFTNAIASQSAFLQRLEDYWQGTPALYQSTSSLFRLSKKLKTLKPIVRDFSRQQLSDISRRASLAYDALCACQLATLTHPTAQAMAEESRAFERWENVAGLEESFLKQKSKLHWLKVGDKNNKVFYNAVKERQSKNTLHEVKDPAGIILTDPQEIKNEAVRFFSELLSLEPDDYTGIAVERLQDLLPFRCSVADQTQLVAEISEEEIKQTIFHMPLNKSPGPDGYTVEFFKAAWPIIGKDLTVAVQSFFKYGFLPKGLNTTILALIPKKLDAMEMKDYRPISCCNVLYKAISKIIANRLKRILPQFIAPNQSAFIKDRLLMENMLLATELVKDYHKEGIASRCAMKIDISKAFDSVQWSFLLNVLTALHFPDKFIHWIKLCISSASFSVQVNGELAGFFQSKRGLRQGCSLSPYLFVICMNVLSAMLDKAGADRLLGYHPRCQNLHLTHLCFADDIMVFADGNMRSMEAILQVFKDFAAVSGLRISLEKSTLYTAGIPHSTREAILHQFPFATGTLPVRYLGLPLVTKKLSLADCLPLLEKIRMRISSWKHRFLSYAGRLQLLASVIASLVNFWISAFRLPQACVREIEKLCSSFLWSGPDLNPRKSKLAWNDVCKPKQEGGLGLKSIAEANKVCCFKLIWRLMSAWNSLWVNWVQRELIRNDSFWSIKANTSLGSWMWRKLLKYRNQALTFHRMEVRGGTSVSFWFDNWSNLGQLYELLGDRGFIDLGVNSTATIASVVTARRRRRHRVLLLNQIEDEIDKLRRRGLSEEEDLSLWRWSDGNFKSKFSSRDTWNQIRQAGQTNHWSKGLWFEAATPKYAFLSWLATHNRLATGDRMLNWNSAVSSSCVFCDAPIETRDHIFFGCRYSSEIWHGLTKGLFNHHYTCSFRDVLSLISGSIFKGTTRLILRYVFQATIHTIWRERNSRRHGDIPNPAAQLQTFIDKTVRNRLSTLRTQGSPKYEDGLQLWFGSRG